MKCVWSSDADSPVEAESCRIFGFLVEGLQRVTWGCLSQSALGKWRVPTLMPGSVDEGGATDIRTLQNRPGGVGSE